MHTETGVIDVAQSTKISSFSALQYILQCNAYILQFTDILSDLVSSALFYMSICDEFNAIAIYKVNINI